MFRILYHFIYSKFLFYLLPFLFLFSAVQYYYYALPTRIEQYAAQEKEITITAVVSQVMQTSNTGNYKIYLKQLAFPEESFSLGSSGIPAVEYTQNKKNVESECSPIQKKMICQRNGNLLVNVNTNKNIKINKDAENAVLPVPGNYILLKITPKLFETASNLGQYDSFRYQKIHDIHAFAYINKSEECKVLNSKKDILYCWLQSLRERLTQVYSDVLSSKDASIINAMVLGNKETLDNDIKTLYSQNGIVHILAISGLHISILGMGFFNICKRAHLPTYICAVLSILFILLYGRLTGFGVSISRAAVMFFLALTGKMIGRTYDFITSISIAALYILLRNPLLINDNGFLLSFGAVLGIAILYPAWKNIYFAKEGTKTSHFDSFFISFSVFLATLPMIISMYFAYPPYSIFLNLLILPLMSILFPVSLITGGVGLFFPDIAVFLGVVIHSILCIFETICHFTILLPGSIQLTGAVSSWQIINYYVILISSILLCQKYKNHEKCLNHKKQKKRKNFLPLLFIPIAILSLYHRHSKQLCVHFLDVGQGDCCVLELPGGIAAAIDGGSTSISSVGTYRLLPFLKASRIASLEFVFLTHMDNDHINAIQELLQNGTSIDNTPLIRNLAVPALLKQDMKWQKLAHAARQQGTHLFYLYAGDTFMLSGVQFQCLYPEDNDHTKLLATQDPNTASLVLKVSYGDFELLLTGDVTGDGEDYLMEHCSQQLSDIEVLKVAHHGSKHSTSEKFLEFCTPQLSVISCGEKNRYGHPHKELLERLQSINSAIVSTKDSGQITVIADKTGYSVTFPCMPPQERRKHS